MYDPTEPDPDYELVWPRELFRSEATLLSGRLQPDPDWNTDAALLLEEAFAGRSPVDDLQEVIQKPSLRLMVLPTQFLDLLLTHLDTLPEHREPAPYWSDRERERTAPSPELTAISRRQRLPEDWIGMVEHLRACGYLDRIAPRGCVDAPERDQIDALNRETRKRLRIGSLWPLNGGWTDSTFYDLVEMVHDLVARPRHREWHEHGGCGWHYSRFAAGPGRILYRWRVNRLFARHGVPLRLADAGEDTGRLVHVPGDDRDKLVQRILAVPAEPDTRAHAVALFRARDAGVPEKRSAVVALASLLEERRRLLRTELLSKDEGALFQLANEFDLRHRRADQRTDYDIAFLDWIFWWYLATLELTDRLLARRAPESPADAS